MIYEKSLVQLCQVYSKCPSRLTAAATQCLVKKQVLCPVEDSVSLPLTLNGISGTPSPEHLIQASEAGRRPAGVRMTQPNASHLSFALGACNLDPGPDLTEPQLSHLYNRDNKNGSRVMET